MTPAQIKAQFDQAQRLIRDGAPEQAVTLLRSLLLPTGGAPEIHYQLSRALDRTGDTPGAAAALDAALSKRPGDKTLIAAALPVFIRNGDSRRVLDLYDQQIATAPKDIAPRADKAVYLQQIGEFAAASTLLRKLIKQAPDTPDLYRLLFTSDKAKRGEPLLPAMKRLWRNPRLNDHGRMPLGYALAKVHEDIGKTDAVFGYLDAANAAQGRLAPYDPEIYDQEWQAYKAAQDGLDLTPIGPELSPRPVFISGMPRSGTTLVDQIIGAHSQVTAGGELGHAVRQVVQIFGPAQDFPRLAQVDPQLFHRFAQTYNLLVRRDTGAVQGVVTDKSMQLQRLYGLYAHALPGARFIVVQRDPRAVALSIYKNAFRLGTHRYANALADIAQEIKAFRAQVRHWQARMPDRIHVVHYEELVSDPEPHSRALIAAAGLEWEEACLSFHTQTSKVKTLSLAQVRQPIHSGRSAAWRKYETELAPFIAAWGDEPWD